MKKWPLIPILLGMVISAACTRKDQAAIAEQAIPQTPEETIRLYQSFLDQNDFEQAKSISTANELGYNLFGKINLEYTLANSTMFNFKDSDEEETSPKMTVPIEEK